MEGPHAEGGFLQPLRSIEVSAHRQHSRQKSVQRTEIRAVSLPVVMSTRPTTGHSRFRRPRSGSQRRCSRGTCAALAIVEELLAFEQVFVKGIDGTADVAVLVRPLPRLDVDGLADEPGRLVAMVVQRNERALSRVEYCGLPVSFDSAPHSSSNVPISAGFEMTPSFAPVWRLMNRYGMPVFDLKAGMSRSASSSAFASNRLSPVL